MPNRPEWFAPKRYGYGAGLPIAWQGWAILFAYAVALLASVWLARIGLFPVAAVIIPATIILIAVGYFTTRGGWRWRWGKGD